MIKPKAKPKPKLANGEKTRKKHGGAPDFLPGVSGNPAGRPKGSRNKLGEAFIADLFADWIAHGTDTIRRVREERPQDYLKVTASLLPKQVQVERVDLSDDELDARIKQLAGHLGWFH